ncbi:Uncharacterised protein [Acidipropionibacterium jensenii]|uniref:Uncharacterized protein n=1 Tax=Acidipropionibacterium jensenii TaxID=1749 RepID=A0A3S4W941_9ACTN|nr:hypothetical protein [Acidipropionibacterium jensenii]VEI03677.1 Uncharacterised protein [Acidipropionibacterium jensenii]
MIRTQQDLDEALGRGESVLDVDSGPEEELRLLRGAGSLFSAVTVHLHGRSRMTISDSMVMAHDESTVISGPDGVVTADGSATVLGSGVVNASGRAHVLAGGSASVTAWGRAHLELADAATARVSGEVSVLAGDDSRVWAGGLAQVQLGDEAMCLVTGMAPDGGVGIVTPDAVTPGREGQVHRADGSLSTLKDPTTWCQMFHVAIDGGIATVYKAVDTFWTTAWAVRQKIFYTPGTCPAAPDWQDADTGGGLHFSPTAFQARQVVRSCTHVVSCGVRVDELRPLTDDVCKAPRVVRACQKVDD